jgi:hypothetical protein
MTATELVSRWLDLHGDPCSSDVERTIARDEILNVAYLLEAMRDNDLDGAWEMLDGERDLKRSQTVLGRIAPPAEVN